jgi:UDP-N-acetylglucosamine:LPS N-acetylglucosamine transferase
MDLATLGKQAIFIPTPGQTEQEYLAQYLMDNKMAYTQSQAQFNLEQALTQLTNFGSLPKTTSNSGLPQAFQEIL